jgi:hypothetical protein
MLGHLVLVNFWTLCIVLLFRAEHSISETKFFPISVQEIGICLCTLSHTDRVNIDHWTIPCKYVHCLLVYKTWVFFSPSITLCFAIYDFALWNCSICWLHHRDIRVSSRQDQSSCSSPQRWGPLRRLSSGYWRSPTWSWPLFCINCRS